MKFPILFLILFLPAFLLAQTQIGNTMSGDADDDEFGTSVAASADGTRVVVGAPLNDGAGTDAGNVRVFQETAGIWTQVGATIAGEVVDDQLGTAVAMSADGTRIAVSAPYNDGDGSFNHINSGYVKILEETAGVWMQVGMNIQGNGPNNASGQSLALSPDGTRVLIGDPRYGPGNDGRARVYQENSGVWTQIGTDLLGENFNDRFGTAVAISNDGTRLAVGAFGNDDVASKAGHVRVFQESNGVWNQVGADIDGSGFNNQSGSAVAISADGTRVAIGAPFGGIFIVPDDTPRNVTSFNPPGQVRIFEEVAGSWTQVGNDIYGTSPSEEFGAALSLSDDGTVLAVGSPLFNLGQGRSTIYEETVNGWTQNGSVINGSNAQKSGSSIALSANGARVIVGSPGDASVPIAGDVRVFGTAILPVQLLSFTARPAADAHLLTWTTATERNNAGFYVEHSTDAVQWRELGFIPGAGDTETERTYTYCNERWQPGSNFYRLRQVDFDGTTSYSDIVQVGGKEDTHSGRVYPNPVTASLTISGMPQQEFTLSDVTGRVAVRFFSSGDAHTLDVHHLPPGIYWLRAEGTEFIERIAKQ